MQDVTVPKSYRLDELTAMLGRSVKARDLTPAATRLASNIETAIDLLRIHTPRSIGRAKELIVRDIDRLTAMLGEHD